MSEVMQSINKIDFAWRLAGQYRFTQCFQK